MFDECNMLFFKHLIKKNMCAASKYNTNIVRNIIYYNFIVRVTNEYFIVIVESLEDFMCLKKPL